MKDIKILKGSINELDLIEHLWEKLNQLHRDLSIHFLQRFEKMDWNIRKTALLKKSSELKFEYVVDKNNKIIAYCISTIEKENSEIGEIDSLYIEEEYRKHGIGKILMDNAIEWLISQGTKTQRLLVACGNENVLDYYKQFDFHPLHIVLQRK